MTPKQLCSDEIVERVARAIGTRLMNDFETYICEHLNEDELCKAARAALAAMPQPAVTDAMIEAGIEAAESCQPSAAEVEQIYLAMSAKSQDIEDKTR